MNKLSFYMSCIATQSEGYCKSRKVPPRSRNLHHAYAYTYFHSVLLISYRLYKTVFMGLFVVRFFNGLTAT